MRWSVGLPASQCTHTVAIASATSWVSPGNVSTLSLVNLPSANLIIFPQIRLSPDCSSTAKPSSVDRLKLTSFMVVPRWSDWAVWDVWCVRFSGGDLLFGCEVPVAGHQHGELRA